MPEPEGAIWWPAQRTLLVADLHLEKGSAYAQKGTLLPPYDSEATLRCLSELLVRRPVERVVCLGDSFHDTEAASRLGSTERAMLDRLTQEREWIWIAGNHDPGPPAGLGGRIEEELVMGALVLRHAAKREPVAGEVSGHYHPKARVGHRLGRFTGRCFVSDGRRLILPAFGAYAGGLDVLSPAIAAHFPDGFHVQVLARGRVRAFPRGALQPVG